MIKVHLLVAHEAEIPTWDAIRFPNVEVTVIGIGQECINPVKDLLKRIEHEKERCLLLLIGTCGSFTRKPGIPIYDVSHGPKFDSFYGTYKGALRTVSRLIRPDSEDDYDWLRRYAGFDMELSHVAKTVEEAHSPYVQNFSCIKVVSDSGAKSLEEWQESVEAIKPALNEQLSKYLLEATTMVDCRIRHYRDFPKDGVNFVDLFPAFTGKILSQFSDWFIAQVGYPMALCPESRGFALGYSVAVQNPSFRIIPIRKKGKLPGETIPFPSSKEYGSDELEVCVEHLIDAASNEVWNTIKCVVLDDVLATGGTAEAIYTALDGLPIELPTGGVKVIKIVGFYFFMELTNLHGRALLERHGVPVESYLSE